MTKPTVDPKRSPRVREANDGDSMVSVAILSLVANRFHDEFFFCSVFYHNRQCGFRSPARTPEVRRADEKSERHGICRI